MLKEILFVALIASAVYCAPAEEDHAGPAVPAPQPEKQPRTTRDTGKPVLQPLPVQKPVTLNAQTLPAPGHARPARDTSHQTPQVSPPKPPEGQTDHDQHGQQKDPSHH